MVFSYSWLNQYLKYTLSPQEIGDLLTMHAFEVESVQEKGDDALLDISVLPNRASDALSHQGMAREINAIAGFKGTFSPKEATVDIELAKAKQWRDALPVLNDFKVTVSNSDDAPLYYALKIEGVKVEPSPDWLKNHLNMLGQDSINNLVDISNFLMLDMGQPTHIFDAKALEGNTLQVRPGSKSDKGEELELLGGTTVRLTAQDLVIADAKKALAIAGIKGGQHSGVSGGTQDIIIEIANFNAAKIYKTSSRLHIATDSAKRFSVGLSYDFVPLAAQRSAQLIQEIAGGNIVGLARYESSEVVQASPSLQHPPIFIAAKRLEQFIGMPIESELMHKALVNLGFSVTQEPNNTYKVQSPYWRIDCLGVADIVEEVVRLYGLNAITAKPPSVQLGEIIIDDTLMWRSFTRQSFVAQGFLEMYNYSFRNSQLPTASSQLIKIVNPISEDKAYLRDNLIDGLLKNVAQNQGLFTQMKLFELGRVFWQEEGLACEREHLAALMYHKKELHFRELRGIVEDFLAACGLDPDDYTLAPASTGQANPFLSFSIQGKELGTIQIPTIPSGLKIKGNVAAFELDAQALYSALTNEREFAPPPKFPSVVRDVSLLLPKNSKGDSVVQVIHEVGSDLIEDVDLFDVYEDAQSQEKSLAFHIMYRSSQKTLTDDEVTALHNQIEEELTKRLHAQIR